MRRVQYAKITTKKCLMYLPTCSERVIALIATLLPSKLGADAGAEAGTIVNDRCGRYIRGKHKGLLRGTAYIAVVEEGGWIKKGPGEGNGHVVFPGQILNIVIGNDFTGEVYLTIGGS